MPQPNQLRWLREQQGWTQAQLAERADVSRAAVSAVEQGRMSPSVDAAIRLARALGRKVEEVFLAASVAGSGGDRWAWEPTTMPTRYWRAHVGSRVVDFPVEWTAQGMLAHDGIAEGETERELTDQKDEAHRTLVLACCDPAVSLLLAAYARSSGFRPICLHRTSREALELLKRGVIHLAGLHLAREDEAGGNAAWAAATLGPGHRVLRMVRWEAGVAVARPGKWTVRSLARTHLRWVGRPAGSGARGCQEEVLGTRTAPEPIARSHRAVVDAIKSGFAEAGVCLRLVSEEAGLPFVPVRRECYDLCLRDDDVSDPRVAALINTVRSRWFRELLTSLPGYQISPEMGELEPVT